MMKWFQQLPGVSAILSHIPPGQFGRYLLVGAWNTLFGYGTFVGFTALLDPHMKFGYLVASAASSSLSITQAFLLYKWFVFKTKGNYLREWLRCVAVYGSNILLNLILLPPLVLAIKHTTRYDRQAPYIAGALLAVVAVIYSFVGHKKFSFRPPSSS
ncbi:MAG TPA: GtrA family protein [Candidatus Angelobacter sp.]|nr:GtrA family protein [Candidatus Angelobacter sp.]